MGKRKADGEVVVPSKRYAKQVKDVNDLAELKTMLETTKSRG